MTFQHLILIVEDDLNSRMLLRDVLGATGYATMEAASAEDGLRLARTEKPALILMDIRLPGMSGIEALQLLRAEPGIRTIPVVAVTASVMQAQQALAMKAGFDALEHKPIKVG
ncbi:MAG: response regulator, partial [Burkholderiales bacterium]